jgi:hypothetical protein
MSDQQTNLKTYIEVWNETSKDTIVSTLTTCVAQDVMYCDPFTDTVQGIDALASVMVGVGKSFPGIKHELVDEPFAHHNMACYRWVATMSGGKKIFGIDYIEFTASGLIRRVMSFTRTDDWR